MVVEGDLVAARSLLSEAQVMAKELGSPLVIAYCLDATRRLAMVVQDFEEAARMLGSSAGILTALANRRQLVDARSYDADFSACCEQLGEARTQTAWQEGRARSADHALESTLAWLQR